MSRYFEVFWTSTNLPLNWRKPENNILYKGGKNIKEFKAVAIHRMQIWRTTRSAPGTSMKVRLVRPRSSEKSCFVDGLVCFISLCLRVFEFLNATRREWNLPQERKSFFSVSSIASEGKTDEVKEFTIAERTGDPKSRNGGMTERRKITSNPKRRNRGITERRKIPPKS